MARSASTAACPNTRAHGPSANHCASIQGSFVCKLSNFKYIDSKNPRITETGLS